MNIQDIPQGESWACRFRTVTFLDPQGQPLEARNLQLGQAHPGQPGVYESVGVIQIRDLEQGLIQVWDPTSQQQFVVRFEDCEDPQPVEWRE
jgi:hypothetical protein